jgi:outer membrane lipoprotein SlyB
MRGRSFRVLVLPLLMLVSLGACASNAVQPGIVYSSGVPSGSGPYYGSGPTYPNSGGGGPYYGSGPTAPGAQPPQQVASAAAQGSAYAGAPGDSGRVVSIREVGLQGGGGGGGNGPFIGGLLGAAGGATIGAVTAHTVGAGIVGGLLGMVGGAILGTIADSRHGYARRGIEVTVQRDDGQQVTVAQQDDGDIQLGDRVHVVQNQRGTAQVVRDTTRSPD